MNKNTGTSDINQMFVRAESNIPRDFRFSLFNRPVFLEIIPVGFPKAEPLEIAEGSFTGRLPFLQPNQQCQITERVAVISTYLLT